MEEKKKKRKKHCQSPAARQLPSSVSVDPGAKSAGLGLGETPCECLCNVATEVWVYIVLWHINNSMGYLILTRFFNIGSYE